MYALQKSTDPMYDVPNKLVIVMIQLSWTGNFSVTILNMLKVLEYMSHCVQN